MEDFFDPTIMTLPLQGEQQIRNFVGEALSV